jgi:hypothetical protein
MWISCTFFSGRTVLDAAVLIKKLIFQAVLCEDELLGRTREMENISRGPTFWDFVNILTERSIQYVTVERPQVIFTAIWRVH